MPTEENNGAGFTTAPVPPRGGGEGDRLRVGVIGCGAIGGVVARTLLADGVPGARLTRVAHGAHEDPPGLPVGSVDEVIADSDLVVEAAGQHALAEEGPRVLNAGKDLLIVSVGALAAEGVMEAIRAAGPGRPRLSTGAIGGLDLLRAAARMAPLSRVGIVTRKSAESLVQPWMGHAEATRLRTATDPVEVLRGAARQITTAFPTSANVAAAVALAVGDWDLVEAAVVADPGARLTSHVITAHGPAGEYRFATRNRPSPRTPTSSGVVPHAVLRALADLTSDRETFI